MFNHFPDYLMLLAVGLILVATSYLAHPTPFCHAFHQAQPKMWRSSNHLQRRMVLTTPESIIEQASTQKLLDDLIDESLRTSARRPIMMQFDPDSNWLWRRWKGTIFSETWDSCVTHMIYACVIFVLCRNCPGFKDGLSGFNVLWGQLLSITTFTLTFFVNQSYACWRNCLSLSRRLQGRLQDIMMSLSAHAARKPSPNLNGPSTYTPASRQILELVSRYVRLFNILTYASFTRSHRPILTPRGMRRLVDRGLMTPLEREVLVDAEIPATQRHNAVLLWIIRTFIEGCEAGHFSGGQGWQQQVMEKMHESRAQYGGMVDELQGRMPMAYVHIVQVLVDVVLWLYPFMAYASGMSGFLCVLGTGILTAGYQGLFDLAKQFLDPYDNESFGKGEDPLVVDTLIAETNAGSLRWMYGLEEMPVSQQRIKDGDLSAYLLPVRGYSVEELEQMEVDRLQKERETQELRQREREQRIRAELATSQIRMAAEALIPVRMNETELSKITRPTLLDNVTYTLSNDDGSTFLPGRADINFSMASDVNGIMQILGADFGNINLQGIVPPDTLTATQQPVVSRKGDMPVDKGRIRNEDTAASQYGMQPVSTTVEAATSIELDSLGSSADTKTLDAVLSNQKRSIPESVVSDNLPRMGDYTTKLNGDNGAS